MPENFSSNTLTSRYTTGIKLLHKFRTKEKFLQTEVNFFFFWLFSREIQLGKIYLLLNNLIDVVWFFLLNEMSLPLLPLLLLDRLSAWLISEIPSECCVKQKEEDQEEEEADKAEIHWEKTEKFLGNYENCQ